MSDKIITPKMVKKIWTKAQQDNSKALEYLKTRNIDNVIGDVGYIDYLKLEGNFFLKDVIVFPLRGADGKVRGLNTRKTYEKFFIRFLCSNYPLIYSDYDFFDKTLVLTESPICALTLRPYLPDMEVGATLSASMTEQMLTLISCAKKVITLLDNDEAGQRGSTSLEGCSDRVYSVPQHKYEGFKDPNDLYSNDKESFYGLVEYIKAIDRRTGRQG